jgi:hypothetical protein
VTGSGTPPAGVPAKASVSMKLSAVALNTVGCGRACNVQLLRSGGRQRTAPLLCSDRIRRIESRPGQNLRRLRGLLALERRTPVSSFVAGAGPFNLDDVGTKMGEPDYACYSGMPDACARVSSRTVINTPLF